ncbi:MAG: ABC transporter permease [Halorhabdus sp.]
MNYVLKRTGRALFTIWAVITLTFGLIRLLPGGPMQALRGYLLQQNPSISPSELQARIEALTAISPDKPIWAQYIDYIWGLLHGNLGQSIWLNKPVSTVLAQRAPWTLFVMTTGLFLMFVIGIGLGAFMAYREGSKFDVGFTGVGILLQSVPFYVVGLILLAFVGYQWELLPTGGHYASGIQPGLNPRFVISAIKHAALPIGSLVLTGFGGWALNMRGNSIRILGEDYLRVARLRGLSEGRIALRYVGRNALLPMYTLLLISIGYMFGGSVILEIIFTYPGLGRKLIQSIGRRDFPVMMGAFLLITVAVVIGIFVADLTYGFIDPRASGGGERESY